MTDTVDEIDSDEFEAIAIRIKHILEIYPRISPTMLQAGLGPQVKPEFWRPVLEDMVANGVVMQQTHTSKSPAGRYNDYQIVSLTTST